KVFGTPGHDTPATTQAAQSACAPSNGNDFSCRQVRYTAGGVATERSLVETVLYDGPVATPDTSDKDHGHYWIGGAGGRDGRYALRRGPSYPDIVWDFFSRHPREVVDAPPPPPIPPQACDTRTDSPVAHLTAKRAVRGGFFLLSALSSGDRRPIGLSFDGFSKVTLREGAPGQWYTGTPAGCAP
ncbi:MAG TPA: hypothetical protein VGP22_15190, partial [Albitalea sp.]|nr:hypothetical protein [Albitalea sp.]